MSIRNETLALAAIAGFLLTTPAAALQSDRQQPLEVNADSTDGTLGDGITTLRGRVEIRQGSLLIRANEAEVEKKQGRVRLMTLRGDTAYLEQEIEDQGQVKAWAGKITYRVADGTVILSGDARVNHPQYEVSGDLLRYDLDAQHFEGMGDENGSGRIRIRLDPEVANGGTDEAEPAPAEDPPAG